MYFYFSVLFVRVFKPQAPAVWPVYVLASLLFLFEFFLAAGAGCVCPVLCVDASFILG